MQNFVRVLEILEKTFPESKGRANALTAKINVKSIGPLQFNELVKLELLGFEVEIKRSGAGLIIVVEQSEAKRQPLTTRDLINSHNHIIGLKVGHKYRLKYSTQFCHAVGYNGLTGFSDNGNDEDRIDMVFVGTVVLTDSMPSLNGQLRNVFYNMSGSDKDRVYMMFSTFKLDYIDSEIEQAGPTPEV